MPSTLHPSRRTMVRRVQDLKDIIAVYKQCTVYNSCGCFNRGRSKKSRYLQNKQQQLHSKLSISSKAIWWYLSATPAAMLGAATVLYGSMSQGSPPFRCAEIWLLHP